jgi:hypothetical protein
MSNEHAVTIVELQAALSAQSKDLHAALSAQSNEIRTELHAALSAQSKKFDAALSAQSKKFDAALSAQGKEIRAEMATQGKEIHAALSAQSEELKEFSRQIETNLLTEFHRYAKGQLVRLHKLESADSDIVLQLATIEERILHLESQRPPTPFPPSQPPAQPR